jgi:hypothetical protein
MKLQPQRKPFEKFEPLSDFKKSADLEKQSKLPQSSSWKVGRMSQN